MEAVGIRSDAPPPPDPWAGDGPGETWSPGLWGTLVWSVVAGDWSFGVLGVSAGAVWSPDYDGSLSPALALRPALPVEWRLGPVTAYAVLEAVFLVDASVRYVVTQSGSKSGEREVGERPRLRGASVGLSLGIAFSVASL